MRYLVVFIPILFAGLFLAGCKKDEPADDQPVVNFKFRFDPTQERLNNLGQPAAVPSGNAGQNPQFNGMSAHYVELSSGAFVPVGGGQVLYKSEETTTGGDTAIVFEKEVIVGEDEVFLSVPISQITPGSYPYLRVSLAYQNFDVEFDANVGFGNNSYTGTLASFVGYNTYISTFKVKDSTVAINSNKLQGFWAFETIYTLNQGQAPATTVPNPLFATSPIPAGSCLVTGEFTQDLVITGEETEDITVVVSISTNKSFEWEDNNSNDRWDPLAGEPVVDMGVRGLIPYVE